MRSLRDEMQKELGELLATFDGEEWGASVQAEIEYAVRAFLLKRGLIARELKVSMAPDGILDVYADDFIRASEVN